MKLITPRIVSDYRDLTRENPKYKIYKITNTFNDKSYVGIATRPETRLHHHFNNSRKGSKRVHQDIRHKDGEGYIAEIIDGHNRILTALCQEVYHVHKNHSFTRGFNSSSAGDYHHLTNQQKSKIASYTRYLYGGNLYNKDIDNLKVLKNIFTSQNQYHLANSIDRHFEKDRQIRHDNFTSPFVPVFSRA